METITMWAEKSSSEATNARRNAPDTHVRNAILSTEDAAKIRKDAEMAIQNDKNIREQRVYHGSGADFDRFDHSHMGEGEGAQAYGWGTYVTEVEGIGRTYAEQNSKKFDHPAVQKMVARMQDMMAEGKTFEEVKSEALERMRTTYEKVKGRDGYKSFTADYEKLKGMTESEFQNRHLYTVEIPDDNGKNYLDWDKPLTDEQIDMAAQAIASNPQKAAEFIWENSDLFGLTDRELVEMHDNPESFSADDYAYLMGKYLNAKNTRGANIYQGLQKILDSDKAASLALNKAGFTGIRYPADFMRGGREDGKKNYVIFNENDAKITDHVRFFRTKDGEAYGYTIGGKIYIDPRIANSETPIHEYAHLWTMALRSGNEKEWQNVVGLMRDTKVWDEVRRKYPELEADDDIADEVLATYSGRRGAERLRKEMGEADGEARGALERVKQALKKFWKATADMLHIHFTSAEDVADRVMKDLLDGVDPRRLGSVSNDPMKGLERAADAYREEQRLKLQKKNGKDEELFLSLQNKKGKEYYDTVTELAERIVRGRIRTRGEVGTSPTGKVSIVQAGLGIISRDKGGIRGMDAGRKERRTEQVAEDWAKSNGYWKDESSVARDSFEGKMFTSGSEAHVYLSKDGHRVVKFVDPYVRKGSDIQAYIQDLSVFNYLFPDTAYDVTGVSRDSDGKFRIVIEQPRIIGEQVGSATDYLAGGYYERVKSDFEKMGLPADEDRISFHNKKYYVTDIHNGNIIFTKDGKMQVIDADARLNKQYRMKLFGDEDQPFIEDTDGVHFRVSDNGYRVATAADEAGRSDAVSVVEEHVTKVSKKLGVKVNVVNSVDEVDNPQVRADIEAGKNVTGWYDEKTGQVHLYMPNVKDTYTAEKTIWHETVGHKGMRGLLGVA